ncbi:uncharacterized protein Z520_05175 [Fonsecaea multimorphosa CBS 102226]|uniref:Uncharacterized protein n=1 Tax=Fonsecaea multimorphosa CBS 102226 TaxID=1442371 RepID=A0A0D2K690_9EURO|nr:uncharacterized protein Z520_05175 [Fonsecaea multimorphosa CBS 102226]KIX98714.1 hypothetical protein Z520_05175 [Fonsecaea multimorphosa CBS 102226]
MQEQQPQTAAFFIRSLDHPQGQLFYMAKPEDVSSAPPVVIRRPPLPEVRQISLQMLVPCVFFVQYPCRQKCRSLGICVHYQFVIGCRKCPDGLRCPDCVQSKVEEAIQANRKCPIHQDPAQANPINNRPEDFLANDSQKEVCDQVLQRSLACQWDDIPTIPTTRTTEEDQWEIHRGDFDRESTPKDMQDVRMLETLDGDDATAEQNPFQMAMTTDLSTFFGGPNGVQVDMSQVFQ